MKMCWKLTIWHAAFRPACSVSVLCAAVLLACIRPSASQTIKATVLSAPLEPVSVSQWSQELGYRRNDLYPLNLNSQGCPFIEIDIGSHKVALMLDTGTSRGFVITNHAPAVPYQLGERHEALNADGSHRGESFGILIKEMSVLGQTFRDVKGTLADWRMFSSDPFNGTVGLEYFLDRRVTIDYRSRQIGTATAALPERLDAKRYITIDLVEPPKSQGHILYVRARVNHRDSIIYLDTGYNVSFLDPNFAEGLSSIERPGRFKVFRKNVQVEFGGQPFILDELREDPIRRGAGFDLPVSMTLGSDFLSRLVLTIDLRAKKVVIALAE